MKKITLSVLTATLLCGPAGYAAAQGGSALSGLEVGGHANLLMVNDVFDAEDRATFNDKFAPKLFILSASVGYAIPVMPNFDIVPEITLGFGLNKHEKNINNAYAKITFSTSSQLTAKGGAKFRYNIIPSLNVYAGPEFILHKMKSTGEINGIEAVSTTNTTKEFAFLLGGGYAITPNIGLDLRADIYDGAVNIAAGAIYKF